MSYDATKGGAAFTGPTTTVTTTALALTYRVMFENGAGGANSLTAIGGTVTGRPTSSAVTWATITATDSSGRAAVDGASVVATDNTPPTNPITDAGAAATSPNFAAVFTPQEVEGERLFRASGCASCHTTVSQVQVVDFFDAGVRPNANLDARLRSANGAPPSVPTTPAPPTVPNVPPPAPRTAAVTIQANAFRPATVTVAAGGAVTWTNLDNARHGVGFLTAGPSNTPIFTSGAQQVTAPTTPGTYSYQCLAHGAQMRGTVVVQ